MVDFFSALLGTLLVGLIQYADHTGRWFEFFGVQKLWGNFLQFPQLPLRFWGGEMIGRLDGTALLFGLSAGLVLLRHLLPGKYAPQTQLPKEVVLSLAYLGGISLTVLLFRGGSLFSLNRFVFAVPFIIVPRLMHGLFDLLRDVSQVSKLRAPGTDLSINAFCFGGKFHIVFLLSKYTHCI